MKRPEYRDRKFLIIYLQGFLTKITPIDMHIGDYYIYNLAFNSLPQIIVIYCNNGNFYMAHVNLADETIERNCDPIKFKYNLKELVKGIKDGRNR